MDSPALDDLDKGIFYLLQQDARNHTAADIAKEVDVTANAETDRGSDEVNDNRRSMSALRSKGRDSGVLTCLSAMSGTLLLFAAVSDCH